MAEGGQLEAEEVEASAGRQARGPGFNGQPCPGQFRLNRTPCDEASPCTMGLF